MLLEFEKPYYAILAVKTLMFIGLNLALGIPNDEEKELLQRSLEFFLDHISKNETKLALIISRQKAFEKLKEVLEKIRNNTNTDCW